MTFGWGGHDLWFSASAEIRMAVGSLLERFPGLKLAKPADEVRWNTTSIWRFPLALPVAW
ncbi:cytochrome P450 [Streptomyces hirsutus]